jgi:hypothetical protein
VSAFAMGERAVHGVHAHTTRGAGCGGCMVRVSPIMHASGRMCVFVVSEERVVVVDVIPGDEGVDVLLQVRCRWAGSWGVGPENHLARRTQHAPITPRGLAHCCPSVE